MTDSRWVDEWLRAWRSFPDAGGANPWTAMLDHFTHSHPAASHQSFSDAVDRISGQSRAFFDLGRTLDTNDGEGWQASVFKYLDEIAERMRDPEAAAQAFGGVSPLGYWQQFAGHAAESTGDRQSLMARFDELLRMPGIGYTREHQESLQELSRLWLEYEQAYSAYAAYCAETVRMTVDRLRARLAREFEGGSGPTSIRALYDIWVDAGEEVHAERVAAQEYMQLHGRMVNALMAYRRRAGILIDQWVKIANLPTREEVDALHRKLKDTRDALRDLEAGGDPSPGARRGKKAAGKKAARKKVVAKKAAGKKAAGKKAVGKKAVGKKAVGKKAVGKKAVGKKAAGKKAAGKKAAGKKAGAGH